MAAIKILVVSFCGVAFIWYDPEIFRLFNALVLPELSLEERITSSPATWRIVVSSIAFYLFLLPMLVVFAMGALKLPLQNSKYIFLINSLFFALVKVIGPLTGLIIVTGNTKAANIWAGVGLACLLFFTLGSFSKSKEPEHLGD